MNATRPPPPPPDERRIPPGQLYSPRLKHRWKHRNDNLFPAGNGGLKAARKWNGRRRVALLKTLGGEKGTHAIGEPSLISVINALEHSTFTGCTIHGVFRGNSSKIVKGFRDYFWRVYRKRNTYWRSLALDVRYTECPVEIRQNRL